MNTTTNLAEFGYRERGILIELLIEWQERGLPDDFSDEGVHPMMNTNSGNVFLTNEEYQVAMINPSNEQLESFYTSPYSGREGFFDDLVEMYGTGEFEHKEDEEWFENLCEAKGVEIPKQNKPL